MPFAFAEAVVHQGVAQADIVFGFGEHHFGGCWLRIDGVCVFVGWRKRDEVKVRTSKASVFVSDTFYQTRKFHSRYQIDRGLVAE